MIYSNETEFENLVISYKCKTINNINNPNNKFENLVISYKCKTMQTISST